MPTVPRRSTSTVATTALPGVRVPTDAPVGAFAGDQPSGPDLSGLARPLAEFAQKQRESADQLALLDADNQLARAQTDLETHAMTRRGKDALGASQDTSDGWLKAVSDIGRTLANDRQRLAFHQRAMTRGQSLYESVERHAAGESLRYDNEQSDAAIKNRINDAVGNYQDPQQVARAALEARAIVADQGRRNGWGAEVVAARQADAVSSVHVGVIERMLSNGEDQAATAYYQKAKSQVAGTEAARIERALDVASTDGAALRGADAVWGELGPKSLNDAVRLSTMEAKARDTFSDNPKVVKAVIAEIRSRAQAHNAEQVELTNTNKAALLGDFAKGATVAQLVRRPEYLALDGAEQERLKTYFRDQSYNNEQRDDAAKARRGFSKFWELSEPTRLSRMSDNAVLALEPEMGRQLVGQLMTLKRSIVKTADAVHEATIDQDLFNTLAAGAGFHPYDTKLSEDDKATLGQLKNVVESEIDAAQRSKGKALTRTEKTDVMQSIIDRKVIQDTWFGMSSESAIASLVRRDERGKYYVPQNEVPPDRWNEMRHYVLSLGGAPRPDKLQRMRAAKMMNDAVLYDQIAREP